MTVCQVEIWFAHFSFVPKFWATQIDTDQILAPNVEPQINVMSNLTRVYLYQS